MSTTKIYDVSRERIFAKTSRVSSVPADPRYTKIYENYEVQQASFWQHKKVDYKTDEIHFPYAPAAIRVPTLKIQGFFAFGDILIGKVLDDSWLQDITVPEIRDCYAFEGTMERIHDNVYRRALIALEPTQEGRDHLFNAVSTMECVGRKVAWGEQWISRERSPAYTLLGKACIEKIFFSSSFAWIDWLKEQKYKFDGLFFANAEISRDEERHVDSSAIIYTEYIEEKITPDNAKEVLDSALDCEYAFIDEIIPSKELSGMNPEMMRQNALHCTALLASQMGYEDMYRNTSTPFGFMKLRSLTGYANFFEQEEDEYVKTNSAPASGDSYMPGAKWSEATEIVG